MYRTLILLATTVFLCGCVRTQKYAQPKMPAPPAWTAGQAGAGEGAEAVNVKWREFFTDEKLQKVIDLALANNRDLRVAALNVERVHSMYRIQNAQLTPTIAAQIDGNVYRMPEKMASDHKASLKGQITAGVGTAAWEPDLFGRIRSLREQALEQYMATQQARTATQIALVAAVANSYLALGADRDNLRLAQETLKTQQDFLGLIRSTREAGMASDLDVKQAQSQVEAAQVDIARYSGQVTLDENALNLLAGAQVASDLLPGELGSERALKDVSAGVPSEVLLRRPDILAAEHQLKAAYANINVARAAFFPRISLTAAAGVMSGDLGNLFRGGAATWQFAPNISLPLFDRGIRKANYKIAEVDRDMAVADYEKAIQTAFREVSDSLSQRTRLMEQQDAQQALVNTLAETYRLSEARYKAGIDSYLSVLVAQRSLYGAQQGLVGLRMARMANLVTLYKVLGGGA